VIGSGTPSQAKRFAAEENLTTPLVTDPSLEAYRRAGMKRGVLRTLGPKSLLHAARALKDGHRQKKTMGDPWQQGGIVVVSPLSGGGHVTMQHAASEAGDPTDLAGVISAVRDAAALARSA
jgi:hypothetical protein